MTSKLMPHCQLPDKAADFVWNDIKPGGALVMEPDRQFFERASGLIVARKWYDGAAQAIQIFHSSLYSSANQTVDEILSYFQSVENKVTIYEGFNEVEEFPGQALTGDRLKYYAEWGQYAAEAFHRAGKRFAFGSFSVGNPSDIEGDWLILAQAVKASDALSLHEYSSPTVLSGDGWYTLRYRKVADRLRRLGVSPRVLITELGIDQVIANGYRGWRQAGITAGQYRDQLAAYDREIQKDDYVLGACIFTCGGKQEWWDFDINGEGEIADYIRTNSAGSISWPAVPSQPGGDSQAPPGNQLVIGEGLRKGESLVGPYLENETYHFPGTTREVSLAVGESGYATWNRKTNETVVITNTGEVYRDWGNQSDNSGKLELVSRGRS